MKYRKRIGKFGCIVLAVAATSALAGPINGAGATSCGTWVEHRKNGTYFPHLNWVLGFVSSYNYYVYIGKRENGVFGTADYNFVSDWMDNYCKDNPRETVYAGTLKLIAELRSHPG